MLPQLVHAMLELLQADSIPPVKASDVWRMHVLVTHCEGFAVCELSQALPKVPALKGPQCAWPAHPKVAP